MRLATDRRSRRYWPIAIGGKRRSGCRRAARKTAEAARAASDTNGDRYWTREKWAITRRTGYFYHGDTATRILDGQTAILQVAH